MKYYYIRTLLFMKSFFTHLFCVLSSSNTFCVANMFHHKELGIFNRNTAIKMEMLPEYGSDNRFEMYEDNPGTTTSSLYIYEKEHYLKLWNVTNHYRKMELLRVLEDDDICILTKLKFIYQYDKIRNYDGCGGDAYINCSFQAPNLFVGNIWEKWCDGLV